MIRLRRYASRIHADHAVAHLREHGVAARVIGDHVQSIFAIPIFNLLQMEVVLLDTDQEPRARKLLDEYDEAQAASAEYENGATSEPPNLTNVNFTPDLSRLDRTHMDVRCPACDASLPIDATIARCPRCSGPVNIVEILIERFGPEALAPCYDSPAIPEDAARALATRCKRCGYNLQGLPQRSRCPECGELFDKNDH